MQKPLNAEIEMIEDVVNRCFWYLNVDLKEGDLVFRANNDSRIQFGNTLPFMDFIPDYNGDPIRVIKAGNYTVKLDLSIPGNYMYHIHRNRL